MPDARVAVLEQQAADVVERNLRGNDDLFCGTMTSPALRSAPSMARDATPPADDRARLRRFLDDVLQLLRRMPRLGKSGAVAERHQQHSSSGSGAAPAAGRSMTAPQRARIGSVRLRAVQRATGTNSPMTIDR
jgi:hypothetical protein